MYDPFSSIGFSWFPNAAKTSCLEPRSVDHEINLSQNQKTMAWDNGTLRRNPEMQKHGFTILITSELSVGKRDANSLAKKRFKSLDTA